MINCHKSSLKISQMALSLLAEWPEEQLKVISSDPIFREAAGMRDEEFGM